MPAGGWPVAIYAHGTGGSYLSFVDDGTAEYYAMIYRNLRQKGHPIPTNDMWIAATALQHGFAVSTYDGHFQYVDGLIAGNRLLDFVF